MAVISRRRFYSIWYGAKRRTSNPNCKDFKNYGKRGITLCKRWMYYKNFEKDMISTYTIGLELERINNNLGYSPKNCIWATRTEQANNKRTNRIIEYKGIRKTLAQWISFLNLKSSTVRQRYYVYKWNVNKCFEFRRRFI